MLIDHIKFESVIFTVYWNSIPEFNQNNWIHLHEEIFCGSNMNSCHWICDMNVIRVLFFGQAEYTWWYFPLAEEKWLHANLNVGEFFSLLNIRATEYNNIHTNRYTTDHPVMQSYQLQWLSTCWSITSHYYIMTWLMDWTALIFGHIIIIIGRLNC